MFLLHNVVIKGTGVYLPANKVYNNFFEEHFNKIGMPVTGLMNHLGRRKRYLATENETSLTMAIEAAKNLISKQKISAVQPDMVVFVSDIPEYLSPTNALKIVDALTMENVSMAFDFNSNCTGMLMAMDIVANYMKGVSKIKQALIIGSFNISSVARHNDSVVYPNFADAAAAILLECSDEEDTSGLLDTETFVDATYHNYVTFPKCGISKIAVENVTKEQKKLEWNPFDMKFISDKWAEMIQTVLERNHFSATDIDYFIFSQLSDHDNMLTLEKLGIEEDNKYFFLGTEYGYTGNTCPILVLNRMWDTIAVKGNLIIFCSVGAGYTAIVQLYRF